MTVELVYTYYYIVELWYLEYIFRSRYFSAYIKQNTNHFRLCNLMQMILHVLAVSLIIFERKYDMMFEGDDTAKKIKITQAFFWPVGRFEIRKPKILIFVFLVWLFLELK